MFIAHQEDWEDIGRAHGEVFAEIRPAATMVVASLLNPKWRVEIEAEAMIP
jgi:enamine deaminase RidA (YjgF/YER057c/UK114 family)